jgi:hypothetical protein
MGSVSLAKKIGIVARVAGRQIERSRRGAALLNSTRTTARSLGRVLHQLWLEVTGFTFLALATFGAIAGFREYAKYQARQVAGPGRVILAVCFVFSFGWFGLSSFLRVKKKS